MVNIEDLAKAVRTKEYMKKKGYDEVEVDENEEESRDLPGSMNSKRRGNTTGRTVTRTKSGITMKTTEQKTNKGDKKSKPEKRIVDVTQVEDVTVAEKKSIPQRTKSEKKTKTKKNDESKMSTREKESKEAHHPTSPPAVPTPAKSVMKSSEICSVPTTPATNTPAKESSASRVSGFSVMSKVDVPRNSSNSSGKEKKKKCCLIL